MKDRMQRLFRSTSRAIGRFFHGRVGGSGFFGRAMTYIILCALGFAFLYPLLYMLSVTFMDTKDLVDATVTWIPTHFSMENLIKAANTISFWSGLRDSLIMTVIPAALQTFVLAMAGYGLARYRVPCKLLWLALAVFVFLIPSQVTMIPRFLLFNSVQLVGTIWPTYLISLLGQGVKSSVFLLIYYNYFGSYPASMDEAARIDGAGPIKIFFRIAIPMAKPALIVTYLFSFIWIWNDTVQLPQFSTGAVTTLPMHLQQFAERFNKLYSSVGVSTGGALNESIRLGGTLLSILPLIVLYFIVQKSFVESIEKTGITGE